MSDLVFPAFPALAILDSPYRAGYRTSIFPSPAGVESRLSWRVKRLGTWAIRVSLLRDDVAAPPPWGAYSELGALMKFFDEHKGAGQSFLFDDPYQRPNLLAYSQDFSQTIWAKTGITITADAVAAPDGTVTADLLTSTVADGAVSGPFTPPSIAPHAISISLQASTPRTVNLYFLRTSPFAVIGQIAASVIATWTRFTVLGSPLDLTQHSLQVGGGGSLPIGAAVYAWGAQAEPGSAARLYVPTGASPITGRNRVRFEEDSLEVVPVGGEWYEASFSLVTVPA